MLSTHDSSGFFCGGAVGTLTGLSVGLSVSAAVGARVGLSLSVAEGAGVGSAVVGVLVGFWDNEGAADTVGERVGGAVITSVGAGETVGESHVFTHRRQSLASPDVFNAVAVKKLSPSLQLSTATAQWPNWNSPILGIVTQAPVWVLSQLHSGPVKVAW